MVKIETSNSSRSDKISSYIFKLAIPFTERPLAFIFNTSVETTHFRDKWKNVRITLILRMEMRLKFQPTVQSLFSQ